MEAKPMESIFFDEITPLVAEWVSLVKEQPYPEPPAYRVVSTPEELAAWQKEVGAYLIELEARSNDQEKRNHRFAEVEAEIKSLMRIITPIPGSREVFPAVVVGGHVVTIHYNGISYHWELDIKEYNP